MIDLRWGVRRNDAITNVTTEFCMREVERCLKQSIGPAFVV